jgi:Flp pilus assembly pilin Flp
MANTGLDREVRADASRLALDERGAISVEYLIATVIGLSVAAALGVLGASMVNAYGQSLQILYSEYP